VTDAPRTDAAAETNCDVASDRVEVAMRLPVLLTQTEAVARHLDRLSEEIRQAAETLRDRARAATPGRAWNDPWSVVDLVTFDLARRGVKSQFGSEADLGAAAEAAARLLEALGLHSVALLDEDSAVRGPTGQRPASHPRA
jgi:hypothetical protein